MRALAGPLPPASTLADRSTLTILRGGGEYSEQARGPIVAAVDGQDVAAGDRLITGPDANLLLTFFEGSTFALSPNTDVVVERLAGSDATRDVTLRLNLGTIWARVVSFGTSAATFQVQAPNATAVVRGSQIGARVLPDGSFQCWTREGAMSVETAAGQTALLNAGETVQVLPDGTLNPSRPFSPAISMVRLLVSGDAWPVLVHPDGGANGVVDPGIVVSQTFGALVQPPAQAGEKFLVEVPANVSGTYTLVLEGRPRDGTTGLFAALATGLLSPIYAGTEDPDERLLGAVEIGGEIGAGELVAYDLVVDVEGSGQPDAVLRSLSVSAPYPAAPPLGPAKVHVSPLELQLAGLT